MQSNASINIKVDNGLTGLANSFLASQNTGISVDSNMVTSTETSTVTIKLDQSSKTNLNQNTIVVLSIPNSTINNTSLIQANSHMTNKPLTMQKISSQGTNLINVSGNAQLPMHIVTQLIAQQAASSPSSIVRTAIVQASPQLSLTSQQVQISSMSGGQGIQRIPTANLRTLAPRMSSHNSSQQQTIIKNQSNNQMTMGSVSLPNNTVPPGFVLMKNEQGQLVIVQQSQIVSNCSPVVQQLRAPVIRPSIVIQQQPQQQQQNISSIQQPRQQNLIRIPLQTSTTPTSLQASQNQMLNNTSKDIVDNVRKCKNFLSTLLKLAANQPEETVRNVRKLIQDLVDNIIVPEYFTSQLQKELKSSPQPYLIPFLKKSLPFLRQYLSSNKMHIEGIRPPSTIVASVPTLPITSLQPTPTTFAQPLQVMQSRSVATVNLTPEQLQQRLQMTQNAIEAQRRRLPLSITPLQRLNVDNSQRPQLILNNAGSLALSSLLTSNAYNTGNAAASSSSTVAVAGARPEKRKYDSIRDDDDINDVATMGGVNLSEESRNILAPTNQLASIKPRSCKDEKFLDAQLVLERIRNPVLKFGIKTVQPEVVNLISHATQERLRSILEKLSMTAEHRMKIFKNDPRYELESEPKRQIKFQQEVEAIEGERQKELENQAIQRAAKSRSKTEDPDQLKKKELAKKQQMQQMELKRQEQSNATALAAIGPRRINKNLSNSSSLLSGSFTGASSSISLRPRIKRVNLRDFYFTLEHDTKYKCSKLLYKSYLK